MANDSKIKLQKKVKDFDFSDTYEGFKATVWVNPPFIILEKLQSRNTKEIYEAVRDLVVKWNFVDEEGKEVNNTVEDIRDKVPADLILRIVQDVSGEIVSPKVLKQVL